VRSASQEEKEEVCEKNERRNATRGARSTGGEEDERTRRKGKFDEGN